MITCRLRVWTSYLSAQTGQLDEWTLLHLSLCSCTYTPVAWQDYAMSSVPFNASDSISCKSRAPRTLPLPAIPPLPAHSLWQKRRVSRKQECFMGQLALSVHLNRDWKTGTEAPGWLHQSITLGTSLTPLRKAGLTDHFLAKEECVADRCWGRRRAGRARQARERFPLSLRGKCRVQRRTGDLTPSLGTACSQENLQWLLWCSKLWHQNLPNYSRSPRHSINAES